MKRNFWMVINLLLVGAAWWACSYALKEGARIKTSMVRKAADLETLRKIEQELSGNFQYREAFQRLAAGRPPDLNKLLEETATGLKAEVALKSEASAEAGWNALSATLAAPAFPLESLGAFLARTVSARPPWRLEACSIQALPGRRGVGKVRLEFSGLASVQDALTKGGQP